MAGRWHAQRELRFQLGDRQRAAKVIALALFAADGREQIGCRAVFDAFGDHGQAELLAQPNRRAHDRGVVGVAQQLEHERAVNFQAVEREFLQVAEARIPGAEIVEYDADAEILDALVSRTRLSSTSRISSVTSSSSSDGVRPVDARISATIWRDRRRAVATAKD